MFVVPVLLVAVVLWLIAKSGSPATAGTGRIDEAVEIVRQRFARGEIDAEEYSRLVSGLTCAQ
jgi:uncharacterized membrane protein